MAAKTEPARTDEPTAKIFISYSRRDMAFTDRLETAIKARGFEPLIDRAEIYAFEDWWKRLQALIECCDTVVFVLSPDSVASREALKEVDYAAALNKRFAPIVCRRVDDSATPETLRRLNFVFFDDAAGFDAAADRLAQALRTDIAWIRRHTEYGEAARRWAGAARPGGLLLRSPVLEDAEHWIAARPRNAPEPTEETRAFVTDSRRGATRRRNILTGSLAGGLVLALGLAGLAYWQRGIAIEQQKYAERALDASVRTSNSLSLDLAMRLRNRAGTDSALVKYLLDQALRLEEQITSFGRVTPDLLEGEGRALLESSLTRRTIGDLAGALDAADRARQTFEKLLTVKPGDPNTRLNLAVSHEMAGDMLLAQGKRDDALAAYRASLATAQEAADAGDLASQEELAIDNVHVGDALNGALKRDEASAAFQTSLTIRQKLADRDPGNAKWQRGLGVSYERVGDMLLTRDKRNEALAAFQKRLAIAQALADGERDNTELQRELSVAFNKMGAVLLGTGKKEDAVDAFQNALAIRQKLADSDPGNTLWQRDVAISSNNIASIKATDGKVDEALADYRKGLAIEQKLAAGDPGNAGWQRDLAISDTRIGELFKNAGKLDEALKAYRDGLAVAQRMNKAHPGDQEWQRELQFCIVQISFVGYRSIMAGEFARGLEAAEQAVSGAPEMIWLQGHRAHALMFLGRTDEAQALYLRYRGESSVFGEGANQMSWDRFVLAEFAELRQAGLANPLMDEIEKQFANGG
jgi:tetratricopeptide (TPR) repeat protein